MKRIHFHFLFHFFFIAASICVPFTQIAEQPDSWLKRLVEWFSSIKDSNGQAANMPIQSEGYRPSWTVSMDTSELYDQLVEAMLSQSPYFSAQLFYQYYTKNRLFKKKGNIIAPLRTEDIDLSSVVRYDVSVIPKFYGVDLVHCEIEGWFQGVDALKRRATLITIVKKAWHENKSVPLISWHLESPYVPHAFYKATGNSIGAIYDSAREFELRPGVIFHFPASHANVPREILQKTKFDDGQVHTDPNGNWLPSEKSTICGRGRIEDGPDLAGYESPSEWYEARLTQFCELLNELTDDKGEGIPFILRLFHEPETRFAWWGYGVSKKDYIEFFRYTVERIRELCPHKNILFAYCKDRYWDEKSYGDRYPGDAYVDLVGFDDYTICTSDTSDYAVVERMRIVSKFAREHKKVAALFETGNTRTEYSRSRYFLSDNLYNCISSEGVNLGLVQIWSTFTTEGDERILNDYKSFLRKPGIRVVGYY